MNEKLRLAPGESLRSIGHRTKGPLEETEIYSYEVVAENGHVVGSVEHTVHVTINGLKTRNYVVQKDSTGVVVVEERW
jgi:hypothetical protein